MSQSGKIQDAQAGDGSMCPSQSRDVALCWLSRGDAAVEMSGDLNSKLVGHKNGCAREAWLWLGSGLKLLRCGLVRMFFPYETHGVVFRVLSQSCFSLTCAEQLRSPC